MILYPKMEGNLLNQHTSDITNQEVNPLRTESIFCAVCPAKRENLELRCERGYWQKQHLRAVEREEELKKEIEQLKARPRIQGRL